MTATTNKGVAAAPLDNNIRESKGKKFLSKVTAWDLGIYRKGFYYKFGEEGEFKCNWCPSSPKLSKEYLRSRGS